MTATASSTTTVKFSIPMDNAISLRTVDDNGWFGEVSASATGIACIEFTAQLLAYLMHKSNWALDLHEIVYIFEWTLSCD